MDKEAIKEEMVIKIPLAEWDNLLAALNADIEPNEALKAAARDYAQGTIVGDVYYAPEHPRHHPA